MKTRRRLHPPLERPPTRFWRCRYLSAMRLQSSATFKWRRLRSVNTSIRAVARLSPSSRSRHCAYRSALSRSTLTPKYAPLWYIFRQKFPLICSLLQNSFGIDYSWSQIQNVYFLPLLQNTGFHLWNFFFLTKIEMSAQRSRNNIGWVKKHFYNVYLC